MVSGVSGCVGECCGRFIYETRECRASKTPFFFVSRRVSFHFHGRIGPFWKLQRWRVHVMQSFQYNVLVISAVIPLSGNFLGGLIGTEIVSLNIFSVCVFQHLHKSRASPYLSTETPHDGYHADSKIMCRCLGTHLASTWLFSSSPYLFFTTPRLT